MKIAPPPPTNRYRFWMILFVVVSAVALGCLVSVMQRVPSAYDRAADLQQSIRQDPRFSEVHAVCAAGKSIIVIAPDSLSPESKAALEYLVQRSAPNLQVPVRYFPGL